MGTRADFYLGRGETAQWLGSIGWDGYPDGIDTKLLEAKTEQEFRQSLDEFFETRDDVTLPERGWPWPWNNSQTTDYAYAFDQGTVYASCFGHEWFKPLEERPDNEDEVSTSDYFDKVKVPFPDMSQRSNLRLDEGSGIILVTARQ